MNPEEKLALIKRNLQEITDEKVLDEIVASRGLSIYWGTAITGKPHIAYFLSIMKIRDFVRAGCTVKILLADIHGFLDNLKAPIEKIAARLEYYRKLLSAMLKRLGVDINAVEFIKGSSFQTSPEYTFDLYRISSHTTVHSTIKAGTQVVKQAENPLLSSLIYPNMQALDEEYLKVDAQFGGVDQRKIFMHANKYLPKLGYSRRIHMMNPMMPGLGSEKMSASDEASKIDLLDERKVLSKKINKCFCEPGNAQTGILTIFKFIIFPMELSEVNVGGTLYEDYTSLEKAFVGGTVHPEDLKKACADQIDMIISPVREEMLSDADLIKRAYN